MILSFKMKKITLHPIWLNQFRSFQFSPMIEYFKSLPNWESFITKMMREDHHLGHFNSRIKLTIKENGRMVKDMAEANIFHKKAQFLKVNGRTINSMGMVV